VTYDADGVTLAMQGKALASAGVGDTIAVQNPVSRKVIQTVVAGPGQAVVGPAAGQLKLAHPSVRYAAR
jgi:flagella basal body P-ring formation protein FlgA